MDSDQTAAFDVFIETPPAQHILRLMCFQLAHDAAFWRAFGAEVPRKAEGEQAFMMTRLLKLAARHGDGWHDAYMKEKRERLEPLEALGRAFRFLGPSEIDLAPFVEEAGVKWCAAKERPYDNADMEYFRRYWSTLPGLRSFVLAAYHRAKPAQKTEGA